MSSNIPDVTMDDSDLIIVLIVSLLLVLVGTVFGLLWYSGIFIPPNVRTCKPPFEELEIIYKYVRGSQDDCSMVYAETHSFAPHLRCVGVYYDNPKEVGDSYVRTVIGLIINDTDKTLPEEEKQRMLVKGFQITKFPAVEHVVYADFPHNSFLSVLVAVHKILPCFRSYIEERKLQAYPLMEICDGDKIVYVAPLSKQSEFFVYEALADSEEEITSEKTVDDGEVSSKDVEELPDTISSVESLVEGGSKVEDLPSNEEVLDSLEEKNKASNGSEASTESFEELQLDS